MIYKFIDVSIEVKNIIDYGKYLNKEVLEYEVDGLTKRKSIYNVVIITHSNVDYI